MNLRKLAQGIGYIRVVVFMAALCGALMASAATTVIANWPFGVREFADLSGNDYALTVGSSAKITDDGYLSLDGTANSAVCTKSTVTISGSDALTVEVWVNFGGSLPGSSFMMLESGEDYAHYYGGFGLMYSGTEVRAYLTTVNGSAYDNTSNAHIASSANPFASTKSAWHHLAVVMVPGETMKLYVDGQDDSQQDRTFTTSIASDAVFCNQVLHIGNRNNSQYMFACKIGGVKITSGAKSAAEILADYGDGEPHPPSSAEASFGIAKIADVYYREGKTYTPEPVVTNKSDGAVLEKGTDYTVEYANNAAPGEATVTVIGAGTYEGQVAQTTFNILKLGEPGLYQQSLSGASNFSTEVDTSKATVVPGALVASSYNASYKYNGVTYTQGGNQTWAYKGVIYLEGGHTYHFYKDYDDSAYIKLTSPDGTSTVVLNNTTWNTYPVATYTTTLSGYYDIDLRVGNGSGGYGPSKAPANSASQLDAGLVWNKDGPDTCTTSNYTEWHKFMNTDDSVFLYTANPGPWSVAEIPDQEFCAAAIEPELVVTDKSSGETLTRGEDYEVLFDNNFAIGTATATIVGEGEYEGVEMIASFAITAPTSTSIFLSGDFSPRTRCANRPVPAYGFSVTNDAGEVMSNDDFEFGITNYATSGKATIWAIGKNGTTVAGDIAVATLDFTVLDEEVQDEYLEYSEALRQYGFLEGVRATGKQWVDTGIVPTKSGTGIDMRFGQVANSGTQTIFGQAWSWGNGYLFQAVPSFYFDNARAVEGYAAGRDYHFVLEPWNSTDGGVVTIDWGAGEVRKTGFNNGVGSAALALFGSRGNYYATCNIYDFKMTANGELVADMRPAQRLSDSVVGFYDLKRKSFHSSKTTTALVAVGSPHPLTSAEFATIPAQDFTGEPVKPALTVSESVMGAPLVEDRDYVLTCSNNFAIGTATAYVTGINDYAGLKLKTDFEIIASTNAALNLAGDFSRRMRCADWPAVPAYGFAVTNAAGEVLSTDDYELFVTNYAATGNMTVWAKVTGGEYAGEVAAATVPVLIVSDDYEYLDYVAANGNQWVDTGLVPTQTGTGIDMRFGQVKNANNQALFGQEWSWGNGYLFQINPSFAFDNARTVSGYAAGRDYHLVIEPYTETDKGVVTIDWGEGAVRNTGYNNGARGSTTLALFGCRVSGNYRVTCRIYSFKMTQNGTLACEFLPARRLADGVPGFYDVIRQNFYASNTATPLIAGTGGGSFAPLEVAYDIPDQYTKGGSACEPEVAVTDSVLGKPLVEGVDYSVSYADNDRPGTGRVILTGLGNYDGFVGIKEFTVVDGGPATPYPNLSRSYVPNGLVGFWDGIDNAGKGEHDAEATTWKDLSRYGNDGVLAETATWANGNAFHNETDGNPCVVSNAASTFGWHNLTWEFAFQPMETDVTRALFSTYRASNYGMIMAHNNGTSYADGSLRYYTRLNGNNNISDRQIASQAKADELAYFTVHSESCQLYAWRGTNFASSVTSSHTWLYQTTANPLVIGGRDDQPTQGFRGDIRFLRVYNRTLSATERAFNRALDRVRHDNRSLKFELPATLPEGYAFDRETDTLSVKISVNALTADGLVAINGGTPAKQVSIVVPVGEVVTIAYSGDGFSKWENLPVDVLTDAEKSTVTFTAGAPVDAYALSDTPVSSASTEISPYSYVQKGLLRLYDGIDNAGTGRHNGNVKVWKELLGTGCDWLLRNSGAFEACGLSLGANRDSAYQETPVPSYATAEFVSRVDSGLYVFSNADDYHRILVVRPDSQGFGAQRYNGELNNDYGDGGSQIAYGKANTYTAVYRDATKSRCDIDYYLNGSRAKYGKSPSSNWSLGSYPALGSRYNENDSQVKGAIYSIRFYDRQLDVTEIAFNAALDRIRFFGAKAADVFANLTLPDGYKWEDDTLKVRLDVTAEDGSVDLADGTWVAAGTEMTVAFTAAKSGIPARWLEKPLNSALSDDGNTISFTAYAPATISVRAERTLSALTYVSDGLIGLWDAIENVAPGTHDGNAWKWYDLTGKQQEPWSLARGRTDFRDDAVAIGGCVNNTYGLVQWSLLPDWNTIESYVEPARTNSAMQLISSRYGAHLFFVDTRPGYNQFGGYYSDKSPVATNAAIAAGVKNTLSIVYKADGSMPETLYLNGDANATRTADYRWSTDSDYPTIGSRYNACDGRYLGQMHVLRMYSRPLSATEVAFNAAIDRVRYNGARLKDVLPATLPDGYRWNADLEQFEVTVVDAGGVTNWYAQGTSVTMTYTPAAGQGVRAWSGLPLGTEFAENNTKATFTVYAPVTASVETAAPAAAYPASAYLSDGLIASWDGYDESTHAAWGTSGEIASFVNGFAFDGSNYMSNYVNGVKTALTAKNLTVQLFLRPKQYIRNGGYLHIGTANAYRDLVLNMASDRNNYFKSQRGAFGTLQCAAYNANDTTYTGLRYDTASYFGKDTLVSIVRDANGARIELDDNGFAFTNNAYSSIPTTDLVNIGTWLGQRNAAFDLYAVRIYDRVLADGECAYNGALDRARFCGEELVLPEGYTNDEGVVKALVTLQVADGSGKISINGGEAAATQTVWLAVGTDVAATYAPASGYAIGGWTGGPASATYADGHRTYKFRVGSPATISATGVALEYGDDNFSASAATPSPVVVGSRQVYAFTNVADGSFVLTAKKTMTLEEALVVGGGGSGGWQMAGGGGGGGVLHFAEPVLLNAGDSMVMSIGKGGVASAKKGSKGSSTYFAAGNLDVEAFGGGGGGGWDTSEPTGGNNIGSGGGRTQCNRTANTEGWHYTSAQGHAGGLGTGNSYNSGGGGGAADPGTACADSATQGHGGMGLAFVTGDHVGVYGSGGGGGGGNGFAAGNGGINAGNGGKLNGNVRGGNGVDGFGGGGGGGGYNPGTYGGNGGCGTVVIALADGDTTAKQFTVCVTNDDVTYLGAALEPGVVVTAADGTVLTQDADYEVTYVDNTAPGLGGVIVKGKGDYAGATATATFHIRKTVFAAETAVGNADGSDWENAMTFANALTEAKTLFNSNIWADVRFKAGTYALGAKLKLYAPANVSGGYLGESGKDETLAETPETTFVGNLDPKLKGEIDTAFYVNAPNAGYWVNLNRLGFGHCYYRGFCKENAVSISFEKCRFFNNTWYYATAITGRGFYIHGSSKGETRMTDCEIFGNGEVGSTCLDPGSGYGGYFGACQRVYLDNCSFVTNGWGGGYRSAAGAAFYADSAPITANGCRFIGNRLVHPETGGTVYLTGNGGGSAFTNCLWLGNCGTWYGGFGNGGKAAPLFIQFADTAQTIDIDHCTFAYNLQGSSYTGYSTVRDFMAPAGINVFCGAAKLRNSILWGNSVSSGCTAGSEIFVYSGSVDIDYTLFDGITTDYIRANGGGEITFGEHIYVGDPRFVTTPADVKKQFGGFATPRSSYGSGSMVYGSRAGSCSFDAHIVSEAANYSLAIDGSNPSEGVVNEPLPNGGIANLGFYGNTSGAATSIVGVATIAASDVAIDFPDGLTAPKVTFSLGSGNEMPYNANVSVYAGSADGTYECRMDFSGVKAGVTNSAAFTYAFVPGTTLYVKVVVSTPGNEDVVVTTTATVAGEIPPWTGHGGDSNKVVHVRAGSTAKNPKGTSWTDAYPDLYSANGALTATRNEMWIAGTLSRTTTPTGEFTLGAPATIRGGFTGVEDSADDRTNAVYSTLSGSCVCTPLVLFNSKDLTVERMRFTGGKSRAIYRKGCNGNLTFENCRFDLNGAADATALAGACIYFERGSYNACTLTVNGCVFEGNGRTASSNAQLDGACIYVSSAAGLYVNDSTFVTNGAPFALTSHGSGSVRPVGTCIYANATPTYVNGCRFAANRSASYKSDNAGGVIYLVNACNNSEINNCAFIGNECVGRTDKESDAGKLGGAIVVNLAEYIRHVYVNNCTFAWNLGAGNVVPADICAWSGIVHIKNSIFNGAKTYSVTEGVGKNIQGTNNGTIDLSYSMFDIDVTNAVGGAYSVGDGCVKDDPLFVAKPATNLADIATLADEVDMRYAAGTENLFVTSDVHLVSAAGYWDNAGAFHEGGTDFSPAIDAGDPTDGYANEPVPNGGFINLGAYGNTTNASMTVTVEPEIDGEVSVTFPDNTSFPQVEFDLKAGIVDYSAIVKVYCGTNGEDWALESSATPLRGGEHFRWLGNGEAFARGSTLSVRIVITSGEHELVTNVSTTVTGEMPKWFGKGGGEHVLHVWADAPGDGDGSDWRNAFHTFDAAVAAYNENIDEIWISGDYTLGATAKFTPNCAFAIRGGFAACENAASERPSGTRSRLDGNNSASSLTLANSTGTPVELERIVLVNFYDRGVSKTGGGDLTVVDCMVLTNGIHGSHKDGDGKGMRITSAAGSTVTVTNTLFSGNRLTTTVYDQSTGQGSGSGICMSSGKHLYVTDCRFYGNGHPLGLADSSHSENPKCYGFSGAAIYTSVPATITYCRMCGNQDTNDSGTSGGIVAFRGAADGSIIKNCVLAGNADLENSGSGLVSSHAGAISVALDSQDYTVDIVNNTIAYNICGGKTAAAGLTVVKGTANVRNCVFFGNYLEYASSDVAVDINVRDGATCNVSYTLLSEDSANSYVASAAGTLNLGVGNIFGDPLFVSPIDDFTNIIVNITSSKKSHIQYSKGTDALLQSFDMHELSYGGYFDNAGAYHWHEGDDSLFSIAVDGGDPADDYSSELNGGENNYYYNGKRINAGAYGNTAEASMSVYGLPNISGDVEVTFPTEFTRPQIDFTIGGEGTFVATAEISVYLDGEEDPIYTTSLSGLKKNQAVSILTPVIMEKTDRLTVRVSVNGGALDVPVVKSVEDVEPEGELPAWYGHGGDPTKVVHVRQDAFGDNDGSDWMNACTDFHVAMNMLTETRNELWIAGTNFIKSAASAYQHKFPIVIRGGFDATEDAIGERKAGAKSILDGDRLFTIVKFANPTNVAIERMVFTKGEERGFEKSGAGDLVMTDCEFIDNVTSKELYGRGGNFSGTAGKTVVAFTNCVFGGNCVTWANDPRVGHGAYFANLGRVYLDHCLFATNGVRWDVNGTSGRWFEAAAFAADNAPVTVTETRFVGNWGLNNGQNGGCIRLTSGSTASVFRNCEFIGNADKFYGGFDNSMGHCSVIVLNADYTSQIDVSLENCTFAYNLCGAQHSPASLYVNNAHVTAKNCIFYHNALSQENSAPTDVYVCESSSATFDYCMFDELSTNCYRAASGGVLTVNDTCFAGDPLLESSTNDVNKLVNVSKPSWPRMPTGRSSLRYNSNLATRDALCGLSTHLRSRIGFYDEQTGELKRFRRQNSPAIDAGDPADTGWQNEADGADGSHGRRINLGRWGGTPNSSMSTPTGSVLRIR